MPFTAMWARLSLFVINSSSAVLSVSRCNSSLGQRSFSYCVPKIRNDVPLSVRQSLSLDSFKRNLKTHYFASNCPPLGDARRLPPTPLIRHSQRSALYKLLWMNEWMNNYKQKTISEDTITNSIHLRSWVEIVVTPVPDNSTFSVKCGPPLFYDVPEKLMCMSRPFVSFDRIGRTSSHNILLLSCLLRVSHINQDNRIVIKIY